METLLPVAAHVLGLLGMAGVLLIPMRIWELAVKRKIGQTAIASRGSVVAAAIASLAIAWSLFIAVETMPVVFRCLYTSQCTAKLAGGLLNLAIFGFSVALVEAIWFGSRFVLARTQHAT